MKKPQPTAEIAATGRYLPERVLTNAELESMVDTTDEWIRERTGITERRIADDDVGAAEMGARAARDAMAKAGVDAGEIDLILLTTATPDRLLPSTACDMQALLGAENAAAMDLAAACTGFMYALTLAESQVATGRADLALIVSTEKMSAIVDWNDRATCVLFGDGAGAALVRRSENGRGILSTINRSDGRLADLLFRPGGGAVQPFDAAVLSSGDHLLKMAGREVFKNAVRSMAEAANQALMRAGITGKDVKLMVPHQANIRIIEATARYADIPMEKVYVNVDRYGTMSSATVPVALDEAAEQGLIEEGDYVLLVAFGAGFTWGASVIRW